MKDMFNKFKTMISPQDEFDDEDYEEMDEPVETFHKPRQISINQQPLSSKVLPISQLQGKMEILNFSMANDDKTGEISNYIKKKKPVIVNMQQLEPGVRQRVVDYLTGACEALNGTVGKVAEDILIFAPEDIQITPDDVKEKRSWQNI